MRRARSPRPPARNRVLPRYLAAALVARIADEGARLSLVLLALDRTGSAAVGGATVAALLVPHVVGAPLVGAAIDRARRPRWTLAAMVLIFAASLFSAALLLGRAPLWLVLVLLLLGGCCGPAITGGLTSQLPGLVGKDNAPRAFGFDSLFYNVASMAGPAIAGLAAAGWDVSRRPASGAPGWADQQGRPHRRRRRSPGTPPKPYALRSSPSARDSRSPPRRSGPP